MLWVLLGRLLMQKQNLKFALRPHTVFGYAKTKG
jgi:hypothetical protein